MNSPPEQTTDTALRVGVRGAAGRMGREACRAIDGAAGMDLVAQIDLGEDPETAFRQAGVTVALDFTVPEALGEGVPSMLRAGARVVVGTSGVTDTQREAWDGLARDVDSAVLVVPNFCVGVVLLQSFCQRAAKFFDDVEVIELHHERKVDSPSGTASDTARRIGEARPDGVANQNADSSDFRGGRVDGIPVHSVRLPGLLAHQEVLFGGVGELLTLRHDTSDRAAFMPGVLLALRGVQGLQGVVVGLEHCLAEQ
ncbi:MAG: 4-hydroxy-tetrahydrodipicolinate reductase [Planctomycetes bacterium]|jgi:4-hydroxy-tetrahydrodipicolinate reductase|nr:4-hydroxy-tetrahydrodipicolinate reductase [Planctomycetota bacterium]MDP6425238.1 4-hydroxy-tetrahydrodipicolinate reductase [Planctomycetota bacterium]